MMMAIGAQGDEASVRRIAELYEKGEYKNALALIRPLAERGDPHGQYLLAVCYDEGKAVKQDLVEARRWFLRAAEQGHIVAQYSLGIMYRGGQGGPKSDVDAVKWWRKAAEKGYPPAQYNLSVMYNLGAGSAKDVPVSIKWLRLAADQTVPEALFDLGLRTLRGDGVTQDGIEAYKLFYLASVQEHKKAKELLEALSARLTSEQKAEAERRIRAFTDNLQKLMSEQTTGVH
jgi:TPR repeat protein